LSTVREFRREDILQVTGLWLRTFHLSGTHPAKALQDYFREMFFESPWTDPELPSLVYEEGGGTIAGFMGVMPRPMLFRGKPVRAAVATQIMVDPAVRGYPAVKLMRRFLAGKQDLSYSDGANDEAERLWSACGGDVARFQSLAWTRVLRPLQYGSFLMSERDEASALSIGVARALSPICGVLDAVASVAGPGARWLPPRPELRIQDEPDEKTLLWCMQNLGGSRSLAPSYDLASLRWLLARCGERQRFGPLKSAVVMAPGGGIAGWYLYHVRRGETAQVLQFGARPESVSKVLNCLFHQARRHGAVAVSGGMEARYTKEIAYTRCGFGWPGYAAVVHSRNSDILNAVHRGDAFLTRLEGEWWARFSDPQWGLEAGDSWAQIARDAVAQAGQSDAGQPVIAR
jgi:hypothetical protein